MATVVYSVFNNTNAINTVAHTATSGNLIVFVGGARDDTSTGVPVFTPPSGFTMVFTIAPMEYHSSFIAWKVSNGTENGAFAWTVDRATNSEYAGFIEFNESGVSTWQVDASANDGSGASNVGSQASGSTGTLSSATGVAAIVGTSRTSNEGLTVDVGTALHNIDAGSANFITAWLSLTSTDALNVTTTQSPGSSRMGSGVAVFVSAGAAATSLPPRSRSSRIGHLLRR